MPEFTVPPLLKWVGTVAGLLTATAIAWVQFGGAVPLTSQSTEIQKFTEDFEIHDLEIDVLKAKQRKIIRKDLFDSIESTRFMLTQYEGRANLTEGDIKTKLMLETDILKYTAILGDMAKEE